MTAPTPAEPAPPRDVDGGLAQGRLDWLWILLLVVLTRLPDLFAHCQDWDEAAMMSEAWAMTRGQVLYRDVFQFHPVLNFAVFVPFFAWLKPAVAPHAIKALNAALVFGGALLVRRVAARWCRDRDCALAAALLFAGLLGSDWALSSYGEFYMLFPLLMSVLLLQAQRPRWFAVGLLWGTAFFLKQVAVFDAVALATGFLLLTRRPAAEAGRGAAMIAAGGAAVAAAVAVYFARHGALADAIDGMFLRALRYRSIPDLPPLVRLGAFGRLILGPAVREFRWCWLLAAAALVAALRGGRRRLLPAELSAPARLCQLWLAADLLGIWSVGKMHLHYALALVPPACLLAGLLLKAAEPRFRMNARRALTAVLVAGSAWTLWPRLLTLSRSGWLDPRARGSLAIAEKIRENTSDDERIFLYGINNLDAFYLSERLSANGVYMYLSMDETWIRMPEVVESLRERLRENPPALLVVNNRPDFAGGSGATRDFFFSLLKERYRRVATIGVADLYRLEPRPDAPGASSDSKSRRVRAASGGATI